MDILAIIAEQRIREAQEKGELDNLPGSGKPLVIEDLGDVPEDLRMAYKILKNSGYIPEAVAERKEIGVLLDLLDSGDERERLKAMTRLRVLTDKFAANRKLALLANDDYYQKILARLEAAERSAKS